MWDTVTQPPQSSEPGAEEGDISWVKLVAVKSLRNSWVLPKGFSDELDVREK